MEKENIVVAEDSTNAPPGPAPLKRVPPMMAEGEEEGELHRIDELIRQLCSGSFCRGTPPPYRPMLPLPQRMVKVS